MDNEKKDLLTNLKEGLANLKALFSNQAEKSDVQAVTSYNVKFKFEIQESTDGETLSIPNLEVGAPVTVASAEGETPASDGWYKVDGDIEIKVEGGVIAEINQPEVAEESQDEEFEGEENAEATADNSAEVIAVVEQAVEAVQAVQAEIEALKTEFSKFSKMDENVKALTDAVQKFSKEPVATSVTEVKENVTNSKEDRIKRLAGYGK
ncbi:hypothetical protein [Sphingobacterium mizutaii]|uniref:hypothetical protein n=1 Tax=Sphingobacterium mizutaii TaxID=1010 RepID=UPI0016272D60|nr:hypothetical protein [Sphingobacterium mizutaii]